jgi:hypothetical protein
MANSVKTTIKVEFFESSALSRSVPSKAYTVETTSLLVADGTQIVGTTHELIAAGDVTDDAMVVVENLHATALVQLGTDTAGAFTAVIDIPAGHPRCIIPVASTLAGLYVKSSVASTSIRVALFKIVAP